MSFKERKNVVGYPEVIELLRDVIGPAVTYISRMHGIVHKRTTAEINGVKGFLVWDYIIYNEITFDDVNGNIYSFFSSISDKETEDEWNKLVEKYGI